MKKMKKIKKHLILDRQARKKIACFFQNKGVPLKFLQFKIHFKKPSQIKEKN